MVNAALIVAAGLLIAGLAIFGAAVLFAIIHERFIQPAKDRREAPFRQAMKAPDIDYREKDI